jgi:signal peptidase I
VDATLLAALLRESMEKGQQPQLAINSNSMAPLLQSGDLIILASVTLEQIQAGDLLTLTTEPDLLTHRYWKQWQQADTVYLLTRGDRPLLFDKPWPVDCLLGRVVARQRQGKVLSLQQGWGKWLNDKLTWLAMIESHWFGIHPGQPTPVLTRPSHFKRNFIWFGAKLLTRFVDIIN